LACSFRGTGPNDSLFLFLMTPGPHTFSLPRLAAKDQTSHPCYFGCFAFQVTSVCFGSNGRQLATGGSESSARLWMVDESGRCLGAVQVGNNPWQLKQSEVTMLAPNLPSSILFLGGAGE
jgi:WD40 repeat protein